MKHPRLRSLLDTDDMASDRRVKLKQRRVIGDFIFFFGGGSFAERSFTRKNTMMGTSPRDSHTL